jgi:hypothetical protein
MRTKRWLVIPFLLVFMFGCNLYSGVQDIKKIKDAASTQMPAILTSAPTAQGMIETVVAQQSSSSCSGTPQTGGLGVSVTTARTVLQMTQQFAFADGTVDGQPAAIATLTASGAASFPDIAQGFSARFIGNACSLDRISVIVPRSDQQATADQGTEAVNMVLTGVLPVDVQFPFLAWITQNYADLAVSGKQQTTIKNMLFTLQRDQTNMILEIVPAK